jgi:hypothetical protein
MYMSFKLNHYYQHFFKKVLLLFSLMDKLVLVKHLQFLIVLVVLSVNYSNLEIKNASSLCLFLRFMVEKFQIY